MFGQQKFQFNKCHLRLFDGFCYQQEIGQQNIQITHSKVNRTVYHYVSMVDHFIGSQACQGRQGADHRRNLRSDGGRISYISTSKGTHLLFLC